MEHNHLSSRDMQVLHCLSCLPQKMVALHEVENLPGFVLHELASLACLNLLKAAYVVDNPDFDYLRGVAGYARNGHYENGATHWDSPTAFTSHMREDSFNQQVCGIHQKSAQRSSQSTKEMANTLADSLQFKDPAYYDWGMKYGNHGILLYEKTDESDLLEKQLPQAVHFLSLCPLF
jgi:hypothetical protein